ncbi:MAG TPA: hypothetical protein PLN31_14550 [Azoarcus taiwanensis]|nr:hypothetical protein [Azoarcus taiwanensis]
MKLSTQQPALATAENVSALANALSKLADKLHHTLRRLTAEPSGDATIAYALLTEEYALRARANILHNDAGQHTLPDVNFSQAALIETLEAVERRLGEASSLEVVQSIVSDLITFASAINPGKAKVLNFLAQELGVSAMDSR